MFGYDRSGIDYAEQGLAHTILRYGFMALLVLSHLVLTSILTWPGGMVVVGWSLVYAGVVIPLSSHRRTKSPALALVLDVTFVVAASSASGTPRISLYWLTALVLVGMLILPTSIALRVATFGVFAKVAGIFAGPITGFEPLPAEKLLTYEAYTIPLAACVVVVGVFVSGASAERRRRGLEGAQAQLERQNLQQSTLLGMLPNAVIEVDASGAIERFGYLRGAGVVSLEEEFSDNPARRDALLGSVKVTAANESAAMLMGVANPVGELDVPRLDAWVRALLGQFLVLVWDGRSRVDFEAETDDGSASYSVTIVNPSADSQGSDRLILSAVDATERIGMLRRLEAARFQLENANAELSTAQSALVQSQKMEAIGVLAAGIAHEINTPIQYVGDNVRFLGESTDDILGLLQTASRVAEMYAQDEDPAIIALLAAVEKADVEFLIEEMPLAVSQALDGIGRVAEIIRAMKDFAHPGGEEAASVDINHAVTSTAIVSRNEWKYVAELETELDPDLPAVPAYSGPLNQVLLNLVVNAAHAIADAVNEGQRGLITMKTSFDDTHVTISITDSGSGIPAEMVAKIFDPFFTTKEVGKGSGQGLAIAHQVVVDRHRGRIDVESEVGVGTTFHIRLPRHVEEVAA